MCLEGYLLIPHKLIFAERAVVSPEGSPNIVLYPGVLRQTMCVFIWLRKLKNYVTKDKMLFNSPVTSTFTYFPGS